MDTILNIKVIPKSSRNEIKIDSSGIIKVYLTTPPIDGKANIDCIKLLAKKLHIAKSDITIIRGHTSRIKTIQIQNSEPGNTLDMIQK